MKCPKSLPGVALVSFGVAAALTLSACGGSAPVSNTAAVRAVVERFEAASYAGDGNTLCSLMTPASRRVLVQFSGLSAGGQSTCATAIAAAIANSGPQSGTLAQTDKSLAAAHVAVTGDAATIEHVNLVRVNGKWLIDLATTFGATSGDQSAKAQAANVEAEESMAYNAAKAASVLNTPTGNYDTGTTLINDITSSEPLLKGVVTGVAAPTLTPTDGLISVAGTTATTFIAVGMTASGQTVTYTVSSTNSSGGRFSVTATNSTNSSPACNPCIQPPPGSLSP